MKLWRVERNHRFIGYDEYVSWVIAHETGQQAIDSISAEKGVTAVHIGEALPDATAGEVLHDSFNAG